MIVHGTTAGTDLAWWVGLVAAVLRIALFTGLSAVLGASLATIGRNTAFALVVAFGWLTIAEGLVRWLLPSARRFLWGENLGSVITWAQLPDADFIRPPVIALTTLLAYAAVVVVVATLDFRRRDIANAV